MNRTSVPMSAMLATPSFLGPVDGRDHPLATSGDENGLILAIDLRNVAPLRPRDAPERHIGENRLRTGIALRPGCRAPEQQLDERHSRNKDSSYDVFLLGRTFLSGSPGSRKHTRFCLLVSFSLMVQEVSRSRERPARLWRPGPPPSTPAGAWLPSATHAEIRRCFPGECAGASLSRSSPAP